MLRKFIVLLLCMMLSGCTQQQGNGENTTVSTISTISNKRQDTIEERTNAFFDKKYNTLIQNYTNSPYSSHIAVNINYPNDILHMYMTSENDENDIQYLLHYDIIDHTHEVDIYKYHFDYLTQGNIRCIKATFHIEFTEFYDDFIYDIFNITILTQDNVELKVKYDMKKQEFYDASEGALENDVMKIDGNMAVAWSGSLNFTVEKSGKSLIGSAASGEGLVNVYRGTGKVLLAPVRGSMA